MRIGFASAALIVAPALAVAPAAGVFTIDGQRFAPAAILDARAQPTLDGHASILVTLAPDGAKRLAAITRAKRGKPIPIALDGKTLSSPVANEAGSDGTVEIGGTMTLPEAETTARRISGKDPVPEEFEE